MDDKIKLLMKFEKMKNENEKIILSKKISDDKLKFKELKELLEQYKNIIIETENKKDEILELNKELENQKNEILNINKDLESKNENLENELTMYKKAFEKTPRFIRNIFITKNLKIN